jgi:hypothetical protein
MRRFLIVIEKTRRNYSAYSPTCPDVSPRERPRPGHPSHASSDRDGGGSKKTGFRSLSLRLARVRGRPLALRRIAGLA